MGFGFPNPTIVGSDSVSSGWYLPASISWILFFRCDFIRSSLYYVPVLVRSYMKVAGYFSLNFCTSGWTILELEAESSYSTICLVPSSHKPELHNLVVMAAKAVPDLQIHKTVKLSKAWKSLTAPPVEKEDVNADVLQLLSNHVFTSLSVLRYYCFWDTLSR